MGKAVILVLHAPTSPHVVVEFVKTSSILRDLRDIVVVITRPGGLAAQSGVPEAWRHAHKSGLPIAILPELSDAIEIYRPSEIYIFSRSRDWIDFNGVEIGRDTMIVFPSGEQPLGKEGVERARYVGFPEFSRDPGPIQNLTLVLYRYARKTREGGSSLSSETR
ncbi:MAG: RecB-family nuclease [Sulfolobales archaeon]